jgi:hypothetical protein
MTSPDLTQIPSTPTPQKEQKICGTCKFWKYEAIERKEFGLCDIPVPRWMKQLAGTARITFKDSNNCNTWEKK